MVLGMALLPGGGVRLMASLSTRGSGETACGLDGVTDGGAWGLAACGSAGVKDEEPGGVAPLGAEGEAVCGSDGVAPADKGAVGLALLAVPGSPFVSDLADTVAVD